MISFYPGPSRVEDKIPLYTTEAHRDGITSMSHRSNEFVAMSKKTILLLKQKLSIPKNFSVFFTSSATECWEVLAQSLITDGSIHLYNGSFGERWFANTSKLTSSARAIVFDQESEPIATDLLFNQGEAICLTQNETSNGTQLTNTFIKAVKKNNPNNLIFVDATSSMAGILLDFAAADVWFASVQKCFGLPAGMGIMILSPLAIEKMKMIGENGHYNSLTLMSKMMALWQTPFTPNVIGIYWLMRVLQERPAIREMHTRTKGRFDAWESFFAGATNLKILVNNPSVRSLTVLPIEAAPALIMKIKKDARKNGLLLGEGYGKLGTITLRIANFPALKDHEIKKLRKFLSAYR